MSEDERGRNQKVRSCDTPLRTSSLLTLPTSKCKRTRAHRLPWLPVLSRLPPPLCLQNPNFEILKLCITIPLHISSPPLHRLPSQCFKNPNFEIMKLCIANLLHDGRGPDINPLKGHQNVKLRQPLELWSKRGQEDAFYMS